MTWHCMLEPVHAGRPAARRPASVGRSGTAMSAVSEVAASAVRQAVGPESLVTVLPNGIDVDRWRPRSAPPDDGVVRVSRRCGWRCASGRSRS